MDSNRLTEKSQVAVGEAQAIATRHGHQQVDVEHLFLALVSQDEGVTNKVLSRLAADAGELGSRVETELEGLPSVQGPGAGPMYFSQRLRRLVDAADQDAGKLKDDFVSVEHFLLALADDSGFSGRLLKDRGITREAVLGVLKDVRGSQRVTSPNPEATYELPWCTTPIEAESSLGPDSHHPIISLSGIPSAVMVFRILHPILASTLCAANPLARIAEPTIAL